MAIKTKIISSTALMFAIGIFSVFASAQNTEKPGRDADKAQKHESHEGKAKRGEFGKHRGMRHGGPGMRGGMGRGMGMLRGIELSDAQKEQIRAIHEANKPGEDTMALMRSIREARMAGGTITEEQKAQLKQLREAQREKMKGVHEQVLAVLTPEQKALLETRKAEMKQRREEHRQKRQEMREKRKAAGEAKPGEIS